MVKRSLRARDSHTNKSSCEQWSWASLSLSLFPKWGCLSLFDVLPYLTCSDELLKPDVLQSEQRKLHATRDRSPPCNMVRITNFTRPQSPDAVIDQGLIIPRCGYGLASLESTPGALILMTAPPRRWHRQEGKTLWSTTPSLKKRSGIGLSILVISRQGCLNDMTYSLEISLLILKFRNRSEALAQSFLLCAQRTHDTLCQISHPCGPSCKLDSNTDRGA